MATSTHTTSEKGFEADIETTQKTEQVIDEKKRKGWRHKSKEDKSGSEGDDAHPKKEQDIPPASFTSLFRYVPTVVFCNSSSPLNAPFFLGFQPDSKFL